MVPKPCCMGDRRGGIHIVISGLVKRWREKKCLIALRWIYRKPGIYPAFIFMEEKIFYKWGVLTTSEFTSFYFKSFSYSIGMDFVLYYNILNTN